MFKRLDIFGNNITFTTFREEKFKTALGGFFSIICVIIAIVFSFLFGQDFYMRNNPRIRSQKVLSESAQRIPLTNDILALPWRIEDIWNRPVNFEGLIYPQVIYYTFDYDDQDTLQATNIIPFNLTKCNEKNLKFPQLYKQINISNYYCLDFDNTKFNYTWGGHWSTSFANFFRVTVSICPGEKPFSPENNCTSIDKLQKIFRSDNPWYFSAFYPQYIFNTGELNTPLKHTFINYSYKLDLNLQRSDTWKFKQVFLEDDQGWILPTVKNDSVVSYDKIETQYYFMSDEDMSKTGVRSTFYSNIFFLDKDYDLFNRSFMKVQDLTAIVGGFLKIIMMVFGIVCKLYSKELLKIHLFKEVFECDYFSDDSRGNSKNKRSDLNFKSNLNDLKNIKNITSKELNPITSKLTVVSNINDLSNNYYREENRFHSQNINSVNIIKTPIMIKKVSKDVNNSTDKMNYTGNNKFISNFGSLFIIKKILCMYCLSANNKKFSNILNNFQKYFYSKLDVITYLKTLETFDRVKSLMFNKYQNMSLNYLRKHNISKPLDLENLIITMNEEGSNFKEIINYYNTLKQTNGFTKIDEQILRFMKDEIQNHIIEK